MARRWVPADVLRSRLMVVMARLAAVTRPNRGREAMRPVVLRCRVVRPAAVMVRRVREWAVRLVAGGMVIVRREWAVRPVAVVMVRRVRGCVREAVRPCRGGEAVLRIGDLKSFW